MASFFVSRVDTAVDRRLEAIARTEALALRGTSAVTYRHYQQLFEGNDCAGRSQCSGSDQRLRGLAMRLTPSLCVGDRASTG